MYYFYFKTFFKKNYIYSKRKKIKINLETFVKKF